MALPRNNGACPHLQLVQWPLAELYAVMQGVPCSQCNANGRNLWICLFGNCRNIGCSEQDRDHGTLHFRDHPTHCVQLNLSTRRIWCYLCNAEVFDRRRRSAPARRPNDSSDDDGSPADDDDAFDADGRAVGGLIGLKNIANTCYMNAALQALSNVPPLHGYFMDCGDIVEACGELQQQHAVAQSQLIGATPAQQQQRRVGLARSYHRLVKDMWSGGGGRQSPGYGSAYVVPFGILNGIRCVQPMFRGYQQHDTQEFLRCFMDQLHEELKETTVEPLDVCPSERYADATDYDRSQCSSPTQSLSEAEYETCDSGVSEQSSLSDEPVDVEPSRRTSSAGSSPALSFRRMTAARANSPSAVSGYYSNGSEPANGGQQSAPVEGSAPQQRVKSAPRSIISDVFDGKLLSSVQCLTCDRVSTREETFQDLSLPIPGREHLNVLQQQTAGQPPSADDVRPPDASPSGGQLIRWSAGLIWQLWYWLMSFFLGPTVSLHNCMGAFFSADELKGDNMYSCERCRKLRNGIKYSRVLQLPEMLCVHLKRFRHDLSYSTKITAPVRFPLAGLDMREYLHRDCRSRISSYDLTAVVCHHGTVGGGHYTCFARHSRNGRWYEYDDQLVTQVPEETVAQCEAYVLFYRKSNAQMEAVRTQCVQLMNRTDGEPGDLRFYVAKQWLNRFNTFAEPGPIDNWRLLCEHGAVTPGKAPIRHELAVPLPQPLWDFFHGRFGGGPVLNELYECEVCRRAAEALRRRQLAELQAFQRLKDVPSAALYAISMQWLRQWQTFATGDVLDVNGAGGGADVQPPGPIANAAIAGQAAGVSATTPVTGKWKTKTAVLRTVRAGSDYAQINGRLWRYFVRVYGGGPTILLRGMPEDEDDLDSDEEEVMREVYDEHERMVGARVETLEAMMVDDEQAMAEQDLLANGTDDAVQRAPDIRATGKSVSFEDDEAMEVAMTGDDEPMAEREDAIVVAVDETDVVSVACNGSTGNGSDCTTMVAEESCGEQPQQHGSDTTNESSGSHRRHHHHHQRHQPLDLVSKRDKRHRKGITTNGLFGPEGTYSSSQSMAEHLNIPQGAAHSEHHSNGQRPAGDSVATGANGASGEPDANEVTSDGNGGAHPEANGSSNPRKAYKLRKKLKLGRRSSGGGKQAHYQTQSAVPVQWQSDD